MPSSSSNPEGTPIIISRFKGCRMAARIGFQSGLTRKGGIKRSVCETDMCILRSDGRRRRRAKSASGIGFFVASAAHYSTAVGRSVPLLRPKKRIRPKLLRVLLPVEGERRVQATEPWAVQQLGHARRDSPIRRKE